ncbi:MAG: hypothetical protein ACPGYV_08100 [Phycisphaeraceae bacterium]
MSQPLPDSAISREQQGRQVFALFSATWAIYGLLHCIVVYLTWVRMSRPDEVSQHVAVMLAGCWVLGRPTSVLRLMVLCVSFLVMEFWDAPYWPNHVFHTMVVNMTLIGVCLVRLVSRPAGLSLPAAIGESFAPLGRVMILALYFWVVVHKLNWDYLNPEVSCGWILYTDVVAFTQSFLGIPLPEWTWMQYPCLLGALVAEAVIPLLLVFPKTRKAGLIFGIAFHTMLTFHANEWISSFSMMLFSTYTLFLSPATRAAIIDWWVGSALGRRVAGGRGLAMTGLLVGALTLYLAVLFGIASIRLSVGYEQFMHFFHTVSPYAAFFTWLSYAGLATYLFFKFVRPARVEPDPRGYYIARPVPLMIVPLLCFLNGFSPYVGLKTHNAYAMFSNLRTEAGVNNHLFLPASFRLVDWQDDLVTVYESNVRRIPANAETARMTWFEFRRRMIHQPDDLDVTYRRNDGPKRTITIDDVLNDPELAPPPYVWRALFWYKTVPPDDGPCPCRH